MLLKGKNSTKRTYIYTNTSKTFTSNSYSACVEKYS